MTSVVLPGQLPAFFADERRACRTADPSLFFPEQGGSGTVAAKAVCLRCPVREDCLEWALDHEGYGVWGAMTADERDAERRRRAGTEPRHCEVCTRRYVPRTRYQRACGSACASRLTGRTGGGQ